MTPKNVKTVVKKETTETKKESVKTFFDATKNLFEVKRRIEPKRVFWFKGFNELPQLIKVVGQKPLINEDLSLKFKKHVVKENDFIIFDGNSQIESVQPLSTMEILFDVVSSVQV